MEEWVSYVPADGKRKKEVNAFKHRKFLNDTQKAVHCSVRGRLRGRSSA